METVRLESWRAGYQRFLSFTVNIITSTRPERLRVYLIHPLCFIHISGFVSEYLGSCDVVSHRVGIMVHWGVVRVLRLGIGS